MVKSQLFKNHAEPSPCFSPCGAACMTEHSWRCLQSICKRFCISAPPAPPWQPPTQMRGAAESRLRSVQPLCVTEPQHRFVISPALHTLCQLWVPAESSEPAQQLLLVHIKVSHPFKKLLRNFPPRKWRLVCSDKMKSIRTIQSASSSLGASFHQATALKTHRSISVRTIWF